MGLSNIVVMKPSLLQLESLNAAGYCAFVLTQHEYEFHPIKSGRSVHLLVRDSTPPKHMPVRLVASHELDNGDTCLIFQANPAVIVTIA